MSFNRRAAIDVVIAAAGTAEAIIATYNGHPLLAAVGGSAAVGTGVAVIHSFHSAMREVAHSLKRAQEALVLIEERLKKTLPTKEEAEMDAAIRGILDEKILPPHGPAPGS